jgi:vacuolar-type H+-ATPase subunit E/Vma4
VSLDPLRRAILEQAQAEADRIRAGAAERAERTVSAAEREGAALAERARADGAALGRLRGARELAAGRRNARTYVLQAERDLYDELRGRAREAVLGLRSDPVYPALLEALAAAARRQLGEDVELEIDCPQAGGVRASVAGRSVDYSLTTLADRCLARLGDRIEELWA